MWRLLCLALLCVPCVQSLHPHGSRQLRLSSLAGSTGWEGLKGSNLVEGSGEVVEVGDVEEENEMGGLQGSEEAKGMKGLKLVKGFEETNPVQDLELPLDSQGAEEGKEMEGLKPVKGSEEMNPVQGLELPLRLELPSQRGAQDPSPASPHEALVEFGFPAGLLPYNVANFTYSPAGDFTVNMLGPCAATIAFWGGIPIRYDATLRGNIQRGKISKLQGVTAEVAASYLWLSVVDIWAKDADNLVFRVTYHGFKFSPEMPSSLFAADMPCDPCKSAPPLRRH